MLTDCNIRINRAQNGYSVSITDPEIVKANDARDSKSDGCAPWRSPDVTYVFATVEKAVDFIKENIEKAFPKDEFSSTFDKAAKESY
jgi:hypothetical protein